MSSSPCLAALYAGLRFIIHQPRGRLDRFGALPAIGDAGSACKCPASGPKMDPGAARSPKTGIARPRFTSTAPGDPAKNWRNREMLNPALERSVSQHCEDRIFSFKLSLAVARCSVSAQPGLEGSRSRC